MATELLDRVLPGVGGRDGLGLRRPGRIRRQHGYLSRAFTENERPFSASAGQASQRSMPQQLRVRAVVGRRRHFPAARHATHRAGSRDSDIRLREHMTKTQAVQ
jgi:hypothetical protein